MLHDATYTQLEVQHNLQPRSLRLFLFLCKCCPFFWAGLFRYVFQWQFISDIRFQIFFLMSACLGHSSSDTILLGLFTPFFFKRVCVCVVDPVFSWCCPALTAFRCYPSGVVLFWHSRIVIAFIISLPKKTGLIFLTFYDIVYWHCLLTACYVVLTFLACGSAGWVWLMRSCFFWRYME